MHIKRLQMLIRRYGPIQFAARALLSPLHELLSRAVIRILCKTEKIDPGQILLYSTPVCADNARYMYDWLMSHPDCPYHFVCLYHTDEKIPEGTFDRIQFVRLDSRYFKGVRLAALKAIAGSRYILYTHSSPAEHFPFGKDRFVVNLWHGCGYKDAPKESRSYFETNYFDLALVPGPVFIDAKKKFWGCDPDRIAAIGYPRYDLLKKDNSRAEEFAGRLRGNSRMLVVWMPTFRKTARGRFPEERLDAAFDLPLLGSAEDLEKLNDYCRENHLAICIKRHPKQLRYSCENRSYSNIHFISSEDLVEARVDLYAFLRYTDALISDYSSAAVDYLLLDRPMAFSLDDYEEYGSSRGFVFEDPRKYMPGHHLYTFEDLKVFLSDTASGADPHAADRAKVFPLLLKPQDNYCEAVWKLILKGSKKDSGKEKHVRQ